MECCPHENRITYSVWCTWRRPVYNSICRESVVVAIGWQRKLFRNRQYCIEMCVCVCGLNASTLAWNSASHDYANRQTNCLRHTIEDHKMTNDHHHAVIEPKKEISGNKQSTKRKILNADAYWVHCIRIVCLHRRSSHIHIYPIETRDTRDSIETDSDGVIYEAMRKRWAATSAQAGIWVFQWARARAARRTLHVRHIRRESCMLHHHTSYAESNIFFFHFYSCE